MGLAEKLLALWNPLLNRPVLVELQISLLHLQKATKYRF